MEKIFNKRHIRLRWSITRYMGPVMEDFSLADAMAVFLISAKDRWALSYTIDETGVVVIDDLPSNLPEGPYSVECIWLKNLGRLNQTHCPKDWMFFHQAMRARRDNLFYITFIRDEDVREDGDIVLKFITPAFSYGYDGLSSYEIAVLRGEFTGTLDEYTKLYTAAVAEVREIEKNIQIKLDDVVEATDAANKAANDAFNEYLRDINGITKNANNTIASIRNAVDVWIGDHDTQFMGIVNTLPEGHRDNGQWCLLGDSLVALQCWVSNYGSTSWTRFGDRVYDFTDFTRLRQEFETYKNREVFMTEDDFNALTNDGEDLSKLDKTKVYYVYEGDAPGPGPEPVPVGPSFDENGKLTIKSATLENGVLTLKSPARFLDGVLVLPGSKSGGHATFDNGTLNIKSYEFADGELTLKAPVIFSDGELKL